MTRQLRPHSTRHGRTHELTVGPVRLCATVNRNESGLICEIFCKATGGWQGHIDRVCTMASLVLQNGCSSDRIARHLLGDRTEPLGLAGQPLSIYDALGRVLKTEMEATTNE